MRLAYAPVILDFKQPAGTSRGVMLQKYTYLIKVWDENAPDHYGIGEASVFPGLSPEADGRYEYKIVELLANVAIGRATDLTRYPSLQIGLEEALRDFAGGGTMRYFDSGFIRGESELTINGLIWMGDFDTMEKRVAEKLREGFKCLKFKIGALDWEGEYRMLRQVRENHPASELEIRVDANGGFTEQNVHSRLDDLARLDIHSIEQPVKPRLWNIMADLCRTSPVPIALDEELIGIYTDEDRERMLEAIRPQYIILKPSLCGAFSGSDSWIRLAAERNIGWWITSALESNIGLNAIAQYAASKGVTMPQGLGTGALFTTNFDTPLRREGEHLVFDPTVHISREEIDKADWRE